MQTKIDPDKNGRAYQDELASVAQHKQLARRLADVAEAARQIPAGYIKKIVWDKEDGYPEHAWGYIQYSPRPYRQGYGCDGTTDGNVHLIAATLCGRLGIDYAAAYAEAYRSDTPLEEAKAWVADMLADERLAQETVIPRGAGRTALSLALSDLYQVNNRSLVEVIEEKLRAAGRLVVFRG